MRFASDKGEHATQAAASIEYGIYGSICSDVETILCK